VRSETKRDRDPRLGRAKEPKDSLKGRSNQTSDNKNKEEERIKAQSNFIMSYAHCCESLSDIQKFTPTPLGTIASGGYYCPPQKDFHNKLKPL